MLIALVGPSLTGCIGSDEQGTDDAAPTSTTTPTTPAATISATPLATAGPGAAPPAPGPGDRPSWTHGDWWEYDITFDLGFGSPFLEGPSKIVVYDTSNGYKVAAGDRNAAIVDQYFDFFFVGSLTADLGTTIEGTEFRMFEFPLTDGKTWSARYSFFGEVVDLKMAATEVPDAGDPAGPTPGFMVVGTSEAGWTFEYVYSPVSKWVTSFKASGSPFGGDPIEILAVKLRENGANYQGTFRVLEMDDLYFRFVVPIAALDPASADPALLGIPPADVVNVPDGFTFVQRIVFEQVFAIQLDPRVPAAAAGAVIVELLDPSGKKEDYMQTSEGIKFSVVTDEPPVTGDWKVAYAVPGTSVAVAGFFAFKEQVVEFTQASHEQHQG